MDNEPSSMSLVLRLRRESACAGHLVGQVEVVETGESIALGEGDDLTWLVRRIAMADPTQP